MGWCEYSKYTKGIPHIKIMLDVAQSAGQNTILGKEWNVDFIAFTAHKSIYGLGIGGFYAKILMI